MTEFFDYSGTGQAFIDLGSAQNAEPLSQSAGPDYFADYAAATAEQRQHILEMNLANKPGQPLVIVPTESSEWEKDALRRKQQSKTTYTIEQIAKDQGVSVKRVLDWVLNR